MENQSGSLGRNYENTSLKMISKEMFQNSSIYPLTQVVRTKSIVRKIWWICVLIIGIFGSAYQITAFLLRYLQYPVVVNLKVENKFILDFPAVTVCNLNRIKKDYLKCIKMNLSFNECSELLSQESEDTQEEIAIGIISERRSSASCSKQFSGQREENMEDRVDFLTKYMALKYEDRKMFSYDKQELIAYCFFSRINCREEDFTYFQSLQYGNCFTFNKKKNNSDVLKVPIIAEKTELELILDLDFLSYLDVTPHLGARIVIHDPSEDPNLEEGGINVSPGFETSVQIKQVCHKRLKAPYTDKCIDYENNPEIPGKNHKECVQICVQKQNLVNCSCVDPTLSALNDQIQCDMTNFTDACCLDNVVDHIAVHGLPCECPPPCFIMSYRKKLSVCKWPSPSFKCSFCRDRSLVSSTMASVKILYSTFDRDTYQQNPMFQNSQLYSNIGSLINLWLGLSLLIIFEITEIITNVFSYYYKRNSE